MRDVCWVGLSSVDWVRDCELIGSFFFMGIGIENFSANWNFVKLDRFGDRPGSRVNNHDDSFEWTIFHRICKRDVNFV